MEILIIGQSEKARELTARLAAIESVSVEYMTQADLIIEDWRQGAEGGASIPSDLLEKIEGVQAQAGELSALVEVLTLAVESLENKPPATGVTSLDKPGACGCLRKPGDSSDIRPGSIIDASGLQWCDLGQSIYGDNFPTGTWEALFSGPKSNPGLYRKVA